MSCKDDPRATICTGFGISPDEYGSFMRFECMKCHKEETIYFNCTSDVIEDLAKMNGYENLLEEYRNRKKHASSESL